MATHDVFQNFLKLINMIFEFLNWSVHWCPGSKKSPLRTKANLRCTLLEKYPCIRCMHGCGQINPALFFIYELRKLVVKKKTEETRFHSNVLRARGCWATSCDNFKRARYTYVRYRCCKSWEASIGNTQKHF